MIVVINPPPAPGYLNLITSSKEDQAVETALRIARVQFECAESSPSPVDWIKRIRELGEDATFVIQPLGMIMKVVAGDDPNAARSRHDRIVDGAQGVLELAALVASLAGPA